jgi:hypothetical protein
MKIGQAIEIKQSHGAAVADLDSVPLESYVCPHPD